MDRFDAGASGGPSVSFPEAGATAPLVVFALPGLCIGGTEVVCVSLANELLKLGYRVDFVFGWEEKGSRLLLPDGARTHMLNVKRTRQVIAPLVQYLRREDPAVLVSSIWPFTTICTVAHRLARSKARMIVWEHNTLSEQYKQRGLIDRCFLSASLALSYPLADARIAVSRGVADDLTELSGVARDSISVIHNPLLRRDAWDDHEAMRAAEAIWGGWRGPRIITVGQLKPQKNHALLIKAFKMLLTKKDARLLILGEGDLHEPIAQAARAEGVDDKVLMPGAVANPMPYYHSANLFALSSDFEGFGNVIVEALSCGLPIVSTDCKSGPSEILEDGRFGSLTPVGDAAALAEAMNAALDTPHDPGALKKRAADFNPENLTGQYLRVLFPEQSCPTTKLV